jgi:hypothetical protein
MIGYAEAEIFSVNETRLHVRACRMVEACPYTDEATGELIRCHELARAVGRVLRLPVQDGKFGFAEHSWLWLSPPEPELARWNLPRILDVYVPGAMPQVQLVDTAPGLCHRYLPDEPRTDVSARIVEELIDRFESLPGEVRALQRIAP